MKLIYNNKKWSSRLLGLTLIALMLFVVGMQCCHTLLAQPQNKTMMSCHHQATSHPQETMLQTSGHRHETSKHPAPCHCESNPSQLSWNHQSDSGHLDLLKPVSLYFQPFQVASIQQHQTNHSRIRFIHPPPASGPPLFITSTLLLI